VPDVFGYIRVSTTRQGEKGVSLQEQKDAILRYAERQGLRIVRWFEEQLTAAKRGRPGFTEMVRLLRRGAADGVIIHKIDRGARNLRDWADLGELIDAGVKVYFANENLDLASRGGRLTADIQAVVAADFIRNNREEVKKGLGGRLKQGLWPFAAPVGYLDQGKGKVKTIDPQRAPLVRTAFELFAAGRHTLDSLVEEMARRGLVNRNGKPFSRDGLWVMLRNSFYIGVMRIRRTGQTFQGVHEPLLPVKLFESVQAVLEGRSYTQEQTHDFVFRRRFTCASCGRALTGSLQKGRVYYRCHTKTCATTSVREDVIEKTVLAALYRISFPIGLRATLEALLRDRKAHASEVTETHRALIQASLQAVEGRLGRLTDAFIDGSLEQELFDSRKTDLFKERGRLRDELTALADAGASLLAKAEEKLQLAETAAILYKTGTVAVKRQTLDRVTCNRTGTGRNAAISLLPPFDKLAEILDSGKCAHYRDRVATARKILEAIDPLPQLKKRHRKSTRNQSDGRRNVTVRPQSHLGY
jgi:DNA invertase Pin-like site-specific DNA recombinase